jgi:hypothetical protein
MITIFILIHQVQMSAEENYFQVGHRIVYLGYRNNYRREELHDICGKTEMYGFY